MCEKKRATLAEFLYPVSEWTYQPISILESNCFRETTEFPCS